MDAGERTAGMRGCLLPCLQSRARTLSLLALAEDERRSIKERHTALLRTHHARFHPIWGQLLKTGHQNSRFAHQVRCTQPLRAMALGWHAPSETLCRDPTHTAGIA